MLPHESFEPNPRCVNLVGSEELRVDFKKRFEQLQLRRLTGLRRDRGQVAGSQDPSKPNQAEESGRNQKGLHANE